jgi:hypothetical protein
MSSKAPEKCRSCEIMNSLTLVGIAGYLGFLHKFQTTAFSKGFILVAAAGTGSYGVYKFFQINWRETK